MENEVTVSGFLALSALYFKMTEETEDVITNDEVELLIANIDKSNLSMLFRNPGL